jgi:hypothetical protein
MRGSRGTLVEIRSDTRVLLKLHAGLYVELETTMLEPPDRTE